jgi:hypothetical protein
VARCEGKMDVAVYNDPDAGVVDRHDVEIDKKVELELATMVHETHDKE